MPELPDATPGFQTNPAPECFAVLVTFARSAAIRTQRRPPGRAPLESRSPLPGGPGGGQDARGGARTRPPALGTVPSARSASPSPGLPGHSVPGPRPRRDQPPTAAASLTAGPARTRSARSSSRKSDSGRRRGARRSGVVLRPRDPGSSGASMCLASCGRGARARPPGGCRAGPRQSPPRAARRAPAAWAPLSAPPAGLRSRAPLAPPHRCGRPRFLQRPTISRTWKAKFGKALETNGKHCGGWVLRAWNARACPGCAPPLGVPRSETCGVEEPSVLTP